MCNIMPERHTAVAELAQVIGHGSDVPYSKCKPCVVN